MAKRRKSAADDREVTIRIPRAELDAVRAFVGLGRLDGEDVMSAAFAVMMEAAESAREDLRSVMDDVRAITRQKEAWRTVARSVDRLSAGVEGDDRRRLELDAPDANGDAVAGGFVIHGTGTPGGFVTERDLDDAKWTVRHRLDRLGEMAEMESLRMQMTMDRLSKMMATLSNLLKKISDTSTSIVHGLK